MLRSGEARAGRHIFSIRKKERERERVREKGVRKEEERKGDTFLSEANRKFCFVLNKEDKWIFQFSSVAQASLTLCNPMDCSMPGLPVHHQLLELAQTHVHQVGDTIQPSHPLSSPSPPAFNLSQHQGFK